MALMDAFKYWSPWTTVSGVGKRLLLYDGYKLWRKVNPSQILYAFRVLGKTNNEMPCPQKSNSSGRHTINGKAIKHDTNENKKELPGPITQIIIKIENTYN